MARRGLPMQRPSRRSRRWHVQDRRSTFSLPAMRVPQQAPRNVSAPRLRDTARQRESIALVVPSARVKLPSSGMSLPATCRPLVGVVATESAVMPRSASVVSSPASVIPSLSASCQTRRRAKPASFKRQVRSRAGPERIKEPALGFHAAVSKSCCWHVKGRIHMASAY